jgi:hypothetical protein
MHLIPLHAPFADMLGYSPWAVGSLGQQYLVLPGLHGCMGMVNQLPAWSSGRGPWHVSGKHILGKFGVNLL